MTVLLRVLPWVLLVVTGGILFHTAGRVNVVVVPPRWTCGFTVPVGREVLPLAIPEAPSDGWVAAVHLCDEDRAAIGLQEDTRDRWVTGHARVRALLGRMAFTTTNSNDVAPCSRLYVLGPEGHRVEMGLSMTGPKHGLLGVRTGWLTESRPGSLRDAVLAMERVEPWGYWDIPWHTLAEGLRARLRVRLGWDAE